MITSASCYADRDTSTGASVLEIFDARSFQNSFVSGECSLRCFLPEFSLDRDVQESDDSVMRSPATFAAFVLCLLLGPGAFADDCFPTQKNVVGSPAGTAVQDGSPVGESAACCDECPESTTQPPCQPDSDDCRLCSYSIISAHVIIETLKWKPPQHRCGANTTSGTGVHECPMIPGEGGESRPPTTSQRLALLVRLQL